MENEQNEQLAAAQAEVKVFKLPEYIKLRRATGWFVIVIAAITGPFFAKEHLLLVFSLAGTAVLINLVLYVNPIVKHSWIFSKRNLLVIDSLIIVLLVLFSDGGFNSPYTAMLLLPIIATATWFGAGVTLITGVVQTIVTVVSFWIILPSNDTPRALANFGLRMFVFTLSGFWIAQITRKERVKREHMAKKDLQIDQERQQLLALINNIGDAVLVIDQIGNITLFNEMSAKLTGSEYALVGKPLSQVFPLQDINDDKLVDLLMATETTTIRRRDLKMQLKDSSVVNIEADISPYIVNKQSRGFIVILRDITKEKTIEEEREEFIAVASHELRTPLTIIEADISNTLASKTPIDDSVRTMLNQAAHNVMFLSNIINDLTTLSQAERDKLGVDLSMLDPSDLVRELAVNFTNQAHNNDLALIVNIPHPLKPFMTNRYRVKQILQNFITNAIKYTPSGSMTISAVSPPDGSPGAVFSVADTGIGLAVTDQKKIFTKFFRSEDYRTRQTSGTGLGLYITAKLAAYLNGKVWFESKLKKGSTFYLQVPPYEKQKEEADAGAQSVSTPFKLPNPETKPPEINAPLQPAQSTSATVHPAPLNINQP
jgi:PAS domain S-box-containing protein